ncbi:MAG: DUF4286 family protein [Gammaproteobacteria bacterium]|nr:DUF4286 family protein [Gammaproteobacteria bacterium]MDH4256064.1 DUF4286 family protein [Gammaproteobacteria bacterium]MDH5311486.1 DUF4286 family protein [Gammaproteobacteria bacterium]
MKGHGGPIYEVTLHVDPEAAADIDLWLAGHVATMLTLPGFIDARVFSIDDEPDKIGRVVQYLVESDGRLQEYIAGPAAEMREDTRLRFGSRYTVSRRVLREATSDADETGTPIACLNCGFELTGQYCGNCGQRAQSRLISILELLRDAFGDLVDIDSRFWRTLVPLAVRPGSLTRDYLMGRRARFMPPFRTYLVLSLLFFLIAFFDPHEELGFLFEPQESGTQDEADAAGAAREEALGELEQQGIIAPRTPGAESEGLRIVIDGEDEGSSCELDDYDPADMPPWLARRLTKERLLVMCQRMTAEDGQGLRGFLDKLLENVPAGLFVLLPLMAFALNVLYPLSKRYYVEHLLFVVHFHAFVFLALTLQILLTRLGASLPSAEAAAKIGVLAVSAYIPVYLHKALRRVYGQGGFVTFLKFLLLFIAYVLGLSLILGIIAIFAAFSL